MTHENKMIKKIKNNNESGQSLVELAVSIIILLILLAGVVDLGRVAYYYIAMRDAAQEAASYASIFPHRPHEILKRGYAGLNGLLTPTEIIYRTNHVGGSSDFECVWEIDPDNVVLPGDCNEIEEVSEFSVFDVIEITIRNEEFPITMPFLATFIGADNQNISLETVIQDVIVRVPEPTPTP